MLTTDLPGLTRLHQGKVRDVYSIAPDERGERLLLVATD
ncbi:MAG: phosphoribosylaminoimidazolesuccinocarboxamide synthase, partial [Chloroflexota bacterium]